MELFQQAQMTGNSPDIVQKIIANYSIKLKQRKQSLIIDCEQVDGAASFHGEFNTKQIRSISNDLMQTAEQLLTYVKCNIDKPHILQITDTKNLMVCFQYSIANKTKIKEMIFLLEEKEISEIDALKIQNQKLKDRMKGLECSYEKELLLVKSEVTKEINISVNGQNDLRQQLAQAMLEISQLKSQINSFSTGQSVLTSWHGKRLRGYPDGQVNCTYDNGQWQKWTWIWLGADKFRWVSSHGTFLRANPNRTVDLAQEPNTWEVWTKETHGDRNWWRSFHGNYLGVVPSGKVDVTDVRKDWQLWKE